METIQPHEELAYIRKIIIESRAAFVEDGKPYILWGIIVALGMGLSYISAITETELYVGYIWIGLVLIGWGTIYYYVREKKKRAERARSFMDRIQGAIWGACGSAVGLTVLLISLFSSRASGDFPPIHQYHILFITSMILGIAYFLSGIANDLNWLRNIGYAWWAGAIVMFIWPSVHMLGLYALMIVVFQVIPGVILMKRYKKITTGVIAEA
ncbi:MAG: hypothetical protein Q8916_15060 [Bacteroidota bacterium]|nr:hypothetical protein [Bacteroidota bacterium]MDP4231717.1 hypothetical protein [Bacteroidota bacterium]MDP4235427.1 hypothetical protein [Bacteroidota bacterium]